MLQEQPKKKTGPFARLATAIVLAAVVIVIWYAIPKKQAPAGSLRYYTDDDGATWFADDAAKVPPFSHNGKQAVLAVVFQQERDGKQFIAYLEKYDDATRARLDTKSPAGPAHAGIARVQNTGPQASGLLVKKPHEGNWIPEEDPAAKEVRAFTAPDGSMNYLPATPE